MVVHKAKLRFLNQQIDDLDREIAAVSWYVRDNPGKEGEKKWLEGAPGILNEAKEVVKQAVEKIKEPSNRFTCLDPDLLRKEADLRCERILGCVQEARGFEIPNSYREDRNSADGYREFKSRSEVMEKILKSSFNIVGVHGVPGVGKTMLLREIKRRAEKLEVAVVMVTVTRNPNLSRIRYQIARGLGLYPFSHELVSQQNQGITDRIRRVLIEKKVLLIFDDVWKMMDFGELGIPLPNKGESSSNCKIVLTYRGEDRGDMLKVMGCQEIFLIDPLGEDDGKELFGKIAADQSENVDLPLFTAELARKCEGLPVAVSALANSLKSKSLIQWMITLKSLEGDNHSIICEGLLPSLDSALWSSFSELKNKQEFLLCCLLGRDASVRDLLNYGTGLGFFSADKSRKESWEEALALVRKFKDSCLLLDGFSSLHYDMNAVVRDFAVAVASKDFGVFSVREENESFNWPSSDARENLKWIYLTKCGTRKLPDELECPQLTFFHLSDKESSVDIPPGFFRQMKKLRVLGLTEMHFSTIPSSIGLLKDLCTLRLDQSQFKGSDIGSVIGELVNLQVLSLAGCDIKKLPKEVAKLIKLNVLDLSDCCDLKVIPPGILSSLTKLEELYMGNSFDQWGENQDTVNASVDEFMRPNLTAIEVCIKSCDMEMVLKDSFLEKLNRYKVFVGDVWNFWGCSVESSNVLKLKLDASIITSNAAVKKLLEKTDELHLKGSESVMNVLNLVNEGFQKLKFLLFEDASEIQHFVHTSDSSKAFPLLEILVLRSLPKLEKIFHVSLDEASFSRLRKIVVENCHQLENLFSFSIASRLSTLQEIEIKDCDNIVEIVSDAEDGTVNDINDEATVVAEPHKQLHSLRLQKLKKFDRFNSRCTPGTLFNEQVDFPRLEELQLSHINLIRIWDCPARSYSIKNLTKLIIEGCNTLQYAFSSTLAKGMEKVRHLEINDCEKMSEIISTEDVTESSEISFPELNFLQISKLKNLTGFCSEPHSLRFPSLKELALKNCPKMKGFTVLTDTDVEQPLFDKQVSFPSLERLTVSHMKNVKILWKTELHEGSFSKLKSLTVRLCEELLTVFPSYDMYGRFFKSLEELGVIRCGSLQAVFELGELEANKTRAVMDTQLKVLFLSRLQKLKYVWNEDYKGTLSFENLQSVLVQYCDELNTLFPASVVLSKLEHLKVCFCGVEEIVEGKKRRKGNGL